MSAADGISSSVDLRSAAFAVSAPDTCGSEAQAQVTSPGSGIELFDRQSLGLVTLANSYTSIKSPATIMVTPTRMSAG